MNSRDVIKCKVDTEHYRECKISKATSFIKIPEIKSVLIRIIIASLITLFFFICAFSLQILVIHVPEPESLVIKSIRLFNVGTLLIGT